MPYLSGKKRELTPEELHKKALKDEWWEKRCAIIKDYDQDRKKYRLEEYELYTLTGVPLRTKSSYAILYRQPWNMRRCRNCKCYVTPAGWYVDLDGRERCMLCFCKVLGPQWSNGKRPDHKIEGSHCVVFYAKKER